MTPACSKHGVIAIPEVETVPFAREDEEVDYTVCLLFTDGVGDELDRVAIQQIVQDNFALGAQALAEHITEEAAKANRDDVTCVAVVVES